jgi:exosortase
VWGKYWLKASFFPYFLLLLMVPLGTMADGITLPLRVVVSKITGVISALLGIQIVQNGTTISNAIQGYKYEVAAACSGLNSLVAFFVLTITYAFICFPFGWRRALVILAGLPLAVACNVLRLTAIVIAAESFGQQAGSFVHEKLGLLFYLPGFILLIWIGERLEKRQNKVPVQIEARVEAKPA